jgi:hypothetical protein
MEEMSKHNKIGLSSMRAGMDRKTGRKYFREGKLPSQMQHRRNWRTRKDPFEQDWSQITKMLQEAPELEAKALFEWLQEQGPGRYEPGQLRTLQRRIKQWRAKYGPDKEVFFAQEHRPAEAMQTDFTWCTQLGVTISGQLFKHMLCHPVLPYSNWQWATVCRSESFAALKRGVQQAVIRLGRVPRFHQTDHSTAATHNPQEGEGYFNEDYRRLMEHFGMTPRTIAVGKSNQNGDVESLNGALKKKLKQHLLLRGSNDFDTVQQYEYWVQQILEKSNQQCSEKVALELKAMKPLMASRLPEYIEEQTRVSSQSTVRIKHNTYSVPSRLIGEKVTVHIYDDRIEIFYAGTLQLTVERLLGKFGYTVDYRHIIWSLVRKPGAFQRYRYRQELFPSLIFRRAYDTLCERFTSGYRADCQYLRILHLAAAVSEQQVETVVELLLNDKASFDAEKVKALVQPEKPQVPEMVAFEADLNEYDELLPRCTEVMS